MKNRISFRNDGFINKKYIKYVVILVVVVALGLVVKSAVASIGNSADSASERTTVAKAVASKDLGNEVGVSLVDEDGENLEGVKMRLDNVEVRDEIIVKGQRATSVAGRSFLVVNLKLINELEQGVEINTRDYFRLGEGNSDKSEWLAPDIHNDPVLVQAISTKPTRIAFPVDADTRQYSLQVGEITGDKEVIEIDFNN